MPIIKERIETGSVVYTDTGVVVMRWIFQNLNIVVSITRSFSLIKEATLIGMKTFGIKRNGI